MTAQNHGNTSAAESNQTPRRDVSRYLLPASLAVFGLVALSAIVSWGVYEYFPFFPLPEDQKGNLSDDSVRKFLELVEADNYDAARKLFYGPSKRIGEPRTFEEFCAGYKRIDPPKCKISMARKGKSGFWTVRVDFEEEANQTYVFFGLKIVDGEWRMERGYSW
ncbi:hypothetical protein CA54_56280 [Symmachiella macrocystis]|uniref:Lumazine-binding domain protein n=1 Tax=Symmachiella macrocystis TaxID=2527985 RepID=A0A5C6B4Y1_9PLAN|nr:hypothetical protein [Symmachiella macrocystis]TWU07223.1 hypothetical protein CA54_56280 [Symmachiella macrocystis]